MRAPITYFRCGVCKCPITWDDAFGWLHHEHPSGMSFDHEAVLDFDG